MLHGNAECWNPNPLLERPPTPIVSLPPPPSSLNLELAFGRVGEVLEATLDKLKETVLGMLGELDMDCRRIEVSSIVHLTDSLRKKISCALTCRSQLGLM